MSTVEVIVLECPQCGAPVQKNSNICGSCFSEYMIRSVSSLGKFDKSQIEKYIFAYKKSISNQGESSEAFYSIGVCYLKIGLYDFAKKSLERAVELFTEDGDVYYYAAISLFKGKRPFLAQLSIVRKAIQYIEAALNMSQEGRYYYLLYLIQKDYFEMKMLNSKYSSKMLMFKAEEYGIVEEEIDIIKKYVSIL